MPRKSRHIPSYRLHKPSGQARVIIDHEHIYLGKFGTPESQENYDRVIAEWLARKQRPPASPAAAQLSSRLITVNELILAFWQHAQQRYIKNGQPTSEIRSFRAALRPVRQLYGREPVTNFGPLALVACRLKLIEAGYCRRRINQHVGRARLARFAPSTSTPRGRSGNTGHIGTRPSTITRSGSSTSAHTPRR